MNKCDLVGGSSVQKKSCYLAQKQNNNFITIDPKLSQAVHLIYTEQSFMYKLNEHSCLADLLYYTDYRYSWNLCSLWYAQLDKSMTTTRYSLTSTGYRINKMKNLCLYPYYTTKEKGKEENKLPVL